MKHLLASLFTLTSLSADAQCPSAPTCSQTVTLCAPITNTAYSGNTCFKGYTSIESSVSFSTFSCLRFYSTDASLNVQPNLTLGGKKLYNTGYAVNYWGQVKLTGLDTIVIGANCTVQLTNLSASGTGNCIVMTQGSRLFIGADMMRYYPGNSYQGITIKSCNSNISNQP